MKIENIAVLSVKHCDTYYDSFENAADASERFVRSASLLPAGVCLGLQIDADRQVFAFSGPGAEVAPEDFHWMFEPCASAEAAPRDSLEDVRAKGRKVYALQRTSSNFESSGDRRYCGELLDALGEAGAILRMTLDTAGRVLISLPGEMTLRMRTLLALAFADTSAVEITESDCVEACPAGYLAEIMTGLLGALMPEQPEQEMEGLEDDPEEPFLDDAEMEDSEEESSAAEIKDGTPLCELDLSVRSYNCLKRAGIDTVGDLRKLSADDLCRIRNLGRKSTEEITRKLAELGSPLAPAQLPVANYAGMLEELIGLEAVKEQVRKITALAKLKQDMAALGRGAAPVVLNMEFVGNPGTAKTTVARILAGVFHQIGLLESGDLVEVGRADLVGRYVGHTADQVKNVFRRAKGKLLLIDEAYSLVENSAGQFGDEAINTIVQEMENHREDTIVIFAGYPDKMDALFAKNPGLRSRVPFQIRFADYSAREMVQIADLEAKRRGFAVCPQARETVAAICGQAALNPELGNGRFCRNLVESAILSYASRVYGGDDTPAEQDFTLTTEDFTAPEVLRETKPAARIGFAA